MGLKMARNRTDFIIIHCAATKPSMDIGRKEIDRWHRARGWNGIGYHFVIRRDGELETGRALDAQGAHARGYNHKSIGICLVGGIDENGKPEDNFTPVQWCVLRSLVAVMQDNYPDAKVIGHNEIAAKSCPSFNVQEKDVGARKPAELLIDDEATRLTKFLKERGWLDTSSVSVSEASNLIRNSWLLTSKTED